MRIAILLCLLSLPVSVAAAEQQTFRAWHGDCDDEGICTLAIRSAGDGQADVTVALRRLQGPAEPWQIIVTPSAPAASLSDTIAFSVDGGPKLTFNPAYDYRTYAGPDWIFLVNEGLAARLLSEMAGGLALEVFYEPAAGGSASARFALPGLSAGMEWIDADQDRDDRDRRVAAPSDLEPDASMAAVRSPVDGGEGERGLPGRLVDMHYAGTGCERLTGTLLADREIVSGRLSDSAILYALPCVATGDTVSYRLYVVETGEIGGIEPLRFAAFSPTHGWIGTDTLTDVAFDVASGTLTSTRSGRDEDGCGRFGRWRWADWRFAMVEYRFRAECGGGRPQTWPVVFELGKGG